MSTPYGDQARLGTDYEDVTVDGHARINDLDATRWRGWVLLDNADDWQAGEVIVTLLAGSRTGHQARAVIDDSTGRAIALNGLSAFAPTELGSGRRRRRR